MRPCSAWLLAAGLAGCAATPPPPADDRTARYNHSLALPASAEPRPPAALDRIARRWFARPELRACLERLYPGVAILDLHAEAGREDAEGGGEDVVRLGVITRGVQSDHERWQEAIGQCAVERARAWWSSEGPRR